MYLSTMLTVQLDSVKFDWIWLDVLMLGGYVTTSYEISPSPQRYSFITMLKGMLLPLLSRPRVDPGFQLKRRTRGKIQTK